MQIKKNRHRLHIMHEDIQLINANTTVGPKAHAFTKLRILCLFPFMSLMKSFNYSLLNFLNYNMKKMFKFMVANSSRYF